MVTSQGKGERQRRLGTAWTDKGVRKCRRYSFPTRYFAFPNNDNLPAAPSKLTDFSPIARDVSVNLLVPEIDVRLWPFSSVAVSMTMPEATVDKDNRLISGQHDIRFARQVRRMQTKSVTHCVQQAAHTQLRSGITGLNPAHQFASLARIENVSHFRGVF
jgi:hypothetical protein